MALGGVGTLRFPCGRQDAFQNTRTIEINGARVPLLGSSEAKAGVDFWPSAMRALRRLFFFCEMSQNRVDVRIKGDRISGLFHPNISLIYK